MTERKHWIWFMWKCMIWSCWILTFRGWMEWIFFGSFARKMKRQKYWSYLREVRLQIRLTVLMRGQMIIWKNHFICKSWKPVCEAWQEESLYRKMSVLNVAVFVLIQKKGLHMQKTSRSHWQEKRMEFWSIFFWIREDRSVRKSWSSMSGILL